MAYDSLPSRLVPPIHDRESAMPLRTAVLLPLAATALLAAAGSPAEAEEYDMDCKMILCLAGGFPSGCGDAFEHMLERLRDGKSPVDSCTMADGRELDDVDADVKWVGAHSRAAWTCPPGSTLHHEVRHDGEGERQVTAFCYETAAQRRQGDGYRTSFTGVSVPTRVDLETRLRMAPGTAAAYDSGVLRIDTGRRQDWRTTVTHRP